MGGIQGAQGGADNVQYDNAIDNAEQAGGLHAPQHPVNKVVAKGEDENTTSQTGGTDETRQATKTVDQEVNERLAGDPEYASALAEYEQAKQLQEFYDLIDSSVGMQFNGNICRDDIIALVNDVHAPNKAARDAAKFLNDHPGIWNALAKGDAFVGAHDVQEYIANKKAAVDAKKSQVKSDVQAERGIQTNQNAATGGAAPATGGAAAPNEVIEEAKNGAPPKPAPSTRGGLEGAEENTSNMMGWMEGEFDRLTALMGKTDDPKAQKQLEMQLNQLSRRMQQMTAMLNQITSMMSNISKMYADIAMNSIRNMR